MFQKPKVSLTRIMGITTEVRRNTQALFAVVVDMVTIGPGRPFSPHHIELRLGI